MNTEITEDEAVSCLERMTWIDSSIATTAAFGAIPATLWAVLDAKAMMPLTLLLGATLAILVIVRALDRLTLRRWQEQEARRRLSPNPRRQFTV